MLETKQEDVIYLARNGTPVVQMTLIPEKPAGQRIGAAAGKFTVPDEFEFSLQFTVSSAFRVCSLSFSIYPLTSPISASAPRSRTARSI